MNGPTAGGNDASSIDPGSNAARQSDVAIVCLADLPGGISPKVAGEVDGVFFASSNTQTFADAPARTAFRHDWLGHYMENYPRCFYVALQNGAAVGYLAGCDRRPDSDPHFSRHVFAAAFSEQWQSFPAHLHVNVDAGVRSRGIGGALVQTFLGRCRRDGLAGAHIVTAAGGRNVAFYRRCGFSHEVRQTVRDRELLFMGQRFE